MDSQGSASKDNGGQSVSDAPHLRLGALGERLATQHLRRDGMRILARNWRHGRGELDIIAACAGTVVFCEVKTRRHLQFGTPIEAVDARKVDQLKALAHAWHQNHPHSGRKRFDIVGVLLRGDGTASVEHRRGAL